MPRISSNWKLTFDPFGSSPIVLLNFGDDIEGEIRFPYRRGLEVVEITEAAVPFLRLKGNSFLEFSFEVYGVETTDALARQAIMQSLMDVEPLGKAPLKVEVFGITDRFWLFTSAVINELDPGRFLETAKPRLSKRYAVTAAGLEFNITLPGGQTFASVAYPPNQILNSFSTL